MNDLATCEYCVNSLDEIGVVTWPPAAWRLLPSKQGKQHNRKYAKKSIPDMTELDNFTFQCWIISLSP